MDDATPIWISESDVVSLMDMRQAIDALERGLRAEAQGDAQNMLKTHVAWDGSTLQAIGATYPRSGFAGTKTWAHTQHGGAPLLILFDSENGSLKAIIEAFALGQMRTASASALATRLLAEKDANDFAIIGTGKQAITQVAAVLAVRPVTRVCVYGRNQERSEQFSKRVESDFQVDAVAAATIEEAVANANIVTVVTRATHPIISAHMIKRGAHVNAVGAIVPSRAEVHQDLLARCTRVVVDSVAQAQKLSSELMKFFGPPEQEEWQRVSSLASLISAGYARNSNDDVTLFKSLGMGISDLALGIEIYRESQEKGLGTRLPQRRRAEPRLRTSED